MVELSGLVELPVVELTDADCTCKKSMLRKKVFWAH